MIGVVAESNRVASGESKEGPLDKMNVVKKRYGLHFDSVLILAGLACVPLPAANVTAQSYSGEPGGNSAAPSSPAHTAHPTPKSSDIAARDARPLIICFGDSLTAGYGIEPNASYPADLQRRLDTAGYRYRVVNEGVSGNTTKDGLERIDRVLARKPQIVVLEFGGNDGLRGLPIENTERNLALMIEKLQSSGTRVALAGISLPPQYGGVYISRFNAMYPTLAKQFHVPLLPFLLQDVYGVEGDIQSDGVHPTTQGAKQVAANVEKLVLPMLKK
jgi:acyl-CoA thioesterase-1